jgi:hypothetical protein
MTCAYYFHRNILFVLSRKSNFSAIWRLSPLTVTGLQFRSIFSTYSFYVPHLLRHRISVFKIISERPLIFSSEYHALGEGAITTNFYVGLTRPSRADAKREHVATGTGQDIQWYAKCKNYANYIFTNRQKLRDVYSWNFHTRYMNYMY